MSRFLEWRFRLGPLGFGLGLRTIELRDALADTSPRALPAAADPLEVGRITLVESPADAAEAGRDD